MRRRFSSARRHGVQQLFALEGLEQVVIRAVADGGKGDRNVVDRGDHHDRHVGKFFLGAFEQANAIEIGHHQVGKHEFEHLAGIKQGEGLHAGTGLLAGIAGGGKDGADNLADCLFVVDYENAIGHGAQSVYSRQILLLRVGIESNHPGPENA